MSWDKRSDFWDDYDYKEIINIIWDNYDELDKEKNEYIEQIDDSKSVLTVPYTIKLRWKKLKFEMVRNEMDEIIDINLLTNFGENVLIDIPTSENVFDLNYDPLNFFDNNGNEIDYQIKVDKPVGGLNYNKDTVKLKVDDAINRKLANPIRDIDGNVIDNLKAGKTITESDITILKNNGIEKVTVKFKNIVRIFENDFDEMDYSLLEPQVENDILEIWVKEYYIHNKLILEMFGPLVGLTKTIFDLNYYSRMYFNMVKALWFVLVNGPTIRNLKIGIYLFFNLPIALREPSEIEIWEEGHIKLTSGEEWTFSDRMDLKEGYYDKEGNWQLIEGVGDTVPRFTFLVDGPQMWDYINHPGWWEEYHYFEHGIDIEKYSTTFIKVNGKVFGDKTRNLEVLGDFLRRAVPEFIMFALMLVIDLDEGKYGGIDKVDVTDSKLNDGTDIFIDFDFLEKRPQFKEFPTYGDLTRYFQFDGEIKYDNFGDQMSIKITEDDVVVDELWRIY